MADGDEMPNLGAMTPRERAELAAQFEDLGVKLSMHTASMQAAGFSRGEAIKLTIGFQAAVLDGDE
jgi:hypothetical protein